MTARVFDLVVDDDLYLRRPASGDDKSPLIGGVEGYVGVGVAGGGSEKELRVDWGIRNGDRASPVGGFCCDLKVATLVFG